MLRVTDEVLEVRCWAEERGGVPCRQPDGRIGLCFGDRIDVALVSWGEFEPTFRLGGSVLVYDDAPDCRHFFIGSREEARAYVSAQNPRLTGAAGPTP